MDCFASLAMTTVDRFIPIFVSRPDVSGLANRAGAADFIARVARD
jgi:hypothetical protein